MARVFLAWISGCRFLKAWAQFLPGCLRTLSVGTFDRWRTLLKASEGKCFTRICLPKEDIDIRNETRAAGVHERLPQEEATEKPRTRTSNTLCY